MRAVNGQVNIRVIMLRILSVLAVNAFVYAGFTMLRTSIFTDDGGVAAVVLYTAVILFAHGAGKLFSSAGRMILDRAVDTKFFRFLSFMLNIGDSQRFVSSSALWALIIIPVVAVLITYGSSGAGRTVFELLPAAVGYIISVKQTRLSHARILSSTSLFIGMGVMVICLEVPLLVSRLEYLRPIYFAVSYFMIFAFLIVKNQEDIEKHIFRKKHIDKSVLPRNLRRFNAMAAGFVFLLMMLLFNLKTVVIVVMDLAKQIIQLVLALIGWLMGKLMEGSSIGGDPMQRELDYMMVQRPMPYFNLVLNTAMYFAILYVTYKLLFAVAARVPAAISKIIQAIKRLFKINVSNDPSVEADYVDTTETVLPDMQNVIGKAKKKKPRIKKLNKITDPVEKVRRMYGNVLEMLPSYGIKRDGSDTTAEILAKAAGTVKLKEDLAPLTEIYDRVRYGDMVPDREALVRAESHYLGCQTRQPDTH